MPERKHKAFVVTSDITWRRFVAYCVEHSTHVQDELGRMVESAVRREQAETTKRVKRQQAARKLLAKERVRAKRKSPRASSVAKSGRNRTPVTESESKRPGVRPTDNS